MGHAAGRATPAATLKPAGCQPRAHAGRLPRPPCVPVPGRSETRPCGQQLDVTHRQRAQPQPHPGHPAGTPCPPTPGCCHPSLPRRPLTFVGVREPDLGRAGVGPAESRLRGGGGGAGGVAGCPRAQAAAQEAPHEGRGGRVPHQAAAGCGGRGESQGGLPVPRLARPPCRVATLARAHSCAHTCCRAVRSPHCICASLVHATPLVHARCLCTRIPRARNASRACTLLVRAHPSCMRAPHVPSAPQGSDMQWGM